MWKNLPYAFGSLKKIYYQPKKLGPTQTWISTIIDVDILDLQCSFFKVTMLSNAQWAMDQPMDLNPLSRLSKKFVLQCIVMRPPQYIYEGGKVINHSNYGICGRWQDFKIDCVSIWIWWFTYMCNLSTRYIFLSWCHHNMDKGENMKRSFGLKQTLDHG